MISLFTFFNEIRRDVSSVTSISLVFSEELVDVGKKFLPFCYHYLIRHVLRKKLKYIRFLFVLHTDRLMSDNQDKKQQEKWKQQQYEKLICCLCHWPLYPPIQLDCCGQRICEGCILATKYYCFTHSSDYI